MVSETGENLGVMSRDEALKEAKERNLDLILIASQANPPVAKIQSYDKFRYQREVELKKQKQTQKVLALKQVQISLREAKNDLQNKAGRVEEFLEKGHRVEIQMTMRGREKGLKEWAKKKMEEFLTLLTIPVRREGEIKQGGRGMLLQIEKEK
ncbi:MAG: translation initiation factor IF-3 [Patescibacteria group bacterium]|nr:translation initiation factor IF-3 [Patescibacteria group bacterium]MDE2144405.1 translation initiation factor IF-3 [Patescibacteria group bacterium]